MMRIRHVFYIGACVGVFSFLCNAYDWHRDAEKYHAIQKQLAELTAVNPALRLPVRK